MRVRPLAILVIGFTLAGCSRGGLDPSGPEAVRINETTTVMTVAAVVVTAIVVAIWIWAAMSPGDPGLSETGQDHDDEARTERRYIIGGGIVLPGLVLASLFGLGLWTMTRTPQKGPLEIEVVGHQFWWEVTYSDGPGMSGTFETANELHVPVGTDVTVRLRSDDVIHSFWVPELVGKVDLIPGRESRMHFSATEPGTYAGYCAEFCGLQHAWMKFEVVAEQPDVFAAWAARQAQPAPDPATTLAQRGREVFTGRSCVGCHAIRGVANEGELGPDLTHLAGRDEIGAGVLALDEANLSAWISNAQRIKGGSKMPPQDLPPDDLDALVAYLLELN